MKPIRTVVGAAVAAGVLVAGVAVAAHAAERPQASTLSESAVEYSGEQYFSGIFFGVGPVARLLPSAEPPTAAGVRPAVLMARIGTENPGFFDDFKEAVTSGDHILVRTAVEDGARLLGGALNDAGVLSEPGTGDDELVWFETAVVAVSAAVVLVVAVAIAVLVVEDSQGIEGDLLFDQYVDEITTNLA